MKYCQMAAKALQIFKEGHAKVLETPYTTGMDGIKGRRDRIIVDPENQQVHFILWGYCVADYNAEFKELLIDHCGYMTPTTKSRLNDILALFNTGLQIAQEKHEWYIGNKKWEHRTHTIKIA